MALDLDKMAETTATRATSRISSILIVPVIGVLGWFAIGMLSEIKDTQKAFWGQIGKINSTLNSIDTNLSVANANFAGHVKDDERIDTQLKETMADHEARIRTLQNLLSDRKPFTDYPK